jgi:hypothetical protein
MAECQACHGSGKLTGRIGEAEHTYPLLPCDACGGCGKEHCCEGERVPPPDAGPQPERDA